MNVFKEVLGLEESLDLDGYLLLRNETCFLMGLVL